MAHFAVTAIGADRPGIVAGLTEALRDVGANLEDVSSTILRGNFSMVFVVDAPEGSTAESVGEALRPAGESLGVSIAVRDVEAGMPTRPVATHALTVYGADRPGIVAAFARLVADAGANVTDLTCRLVGDDRPVYVLVAEVQVARDAGALEGAIRQAADELEVDVSFRARDTDTF